MAPGALSETPSAAVEEARQRIEVVSINGKKVEDAANGTNGVKDEKPVNGESQTETKDEKDETASEAKAGDETKADEEKDSKDETTEPEDQTMKCEIKHLDRRYDDDDEAYFAERKTEVEKPKQKDWWRLFAFCMVRTYDSDNELEGTSLYVNPQPLRQLLFDVIGKYPGNPIDVNDVQIESPYRPLFYYRAKLETEGLERFAEDPESLEHLTLLLSWIKTHFELDIAAYERCTSQPHKVIAYDRLWTLFPPGTVAYCKLLSQNRAFRINDTYYDTGELSPCMGLRAEFVDFDGERLGTRNIELAVPKYQGTRELSDLAAIPLDLIDDVSDLREELLARGRKFEAHIGQHFVQYDGIAIKKTPEGYARFTVNGRVMIDCKTYHRLEPNDSFNAKNFNDDSTKMERSRKRAVGHLTFAGTDGERKFEKLSEQNLLLTNATVRGYSFTAKRFLEFFVEDISEIEWNTKCFDDLVLDAAIKKTVQALVSTHSKKRESFDDIVKGKGMGLVCVLHGPPGVGKTLTAECVAEFVKRPLYMVSSGDRKSLNIPSLSTQHFANTARSRNQQRGPRQEPDAYHGHDGHMAGRAADRRGRRVPGAALAARHAPQRHGQRLPARPRVLLGHPVPHHQPRHHLRRRLQVAHPHPHPLHRPVGRVAPPDLAQLLPHGARRRRHRREGPRDPGRHRPQRPPDQERHQGRREPRRV